MALWVCEECGSLYSVGADRCPQCGSGSYHEATEGDQMPKISKAYGPTYEGILEPRHVTYEDAERKEADSDEPRERTDDERELTGDGTGEALPPADDEPREPVALYESGLAAPEDAPAVEPKSTSKRGKNTEK